MQAEFLIPIFLFGGTAWVLVVYFNGRHKERMAMIEKGVNPADFRGKSFRQWFQVNPLSSLKWGLLAVFVGIGLFVAQLLDRIYFFHESIYFATVLVFGGIALVLFYFIANAKLKNEDLGS